MNLVIFIPVLHHRNEYCHKTKSVLFLNTRSFKPQLKVKIRIIIIKTILIIKPFPNNHPNINFSTIFYLIKATLPFKYISSPFARLASKYQTYTPACTFFPLNVPSQPFPVAAWKLLSSKSLAPHRS